MSASAAPTITGCTIKNNWDTGIKCNGAGQTKILNNLLVSNENYGIYIASTNREVAIRNNTINRNN